VDIIPTSGTGFSARESGKQTIAPGVLTITKETDSPSGNVTNQASGITLAKYKFKAAGEKMKVENLLVGFAKSTTTAVTIRNGSVNANGTQIGSIASIASGGTVFNLGSSLIVEPGKDVIVEVKGDVYNANTSLGALVSGDTFTFKLLPTVSANVQRLVKLDYDTYPSTDVAGNQIVVAAGSMTLTKFSAFANQTIVTPQTAVKVGEYRLQSGSTEDVNLNTITLGVTATNTGAVSAMSDVYLTYGAKTTQVRPSVTATGNTWSINEILAKNSTLEVKVYATLSAAFPAGVSVNTTVLFDGNAVASGQAVTSGTVTGQTVTSGTGSLTVANDASAPVAAVLVAGSMPKVASFKFTGTNDNFTITELYASTTANGSAAIGSLIWKDGATTLATTFFDGNNAITTGLSVAIPANTTKVVDGYLQLGSVGTPGNATTSLDTAITLNGFKSRNSNGVEAVTNGVALAGNAQYVYKTKPTIALAALPSTTLNTGTQTIGKYSVSADTAGSLEWNQIVFTVTKTAAPGLASWALYDEANPGTAIAAAVTPTGTFTAAGGAGGTVKFVLTNPQAVSGTKTYVLKANVTGTIIAGESVGFSIAPTASAPTVADENSVQLPLSSFVWSDLSQTPHSLTSADWLTDYLVKNLPTDSQTLLK